MLDDADFGSVATADDLPAFELTFLSLLNGDAPAADLSLADVAARSGLAEAEITELDELGVIEIKKARGERLLDYRDAAIVERWAQLHELGFVEESGYDASFLKRYTDAVQQLADAEIDQFLDAFGNTGTDEAAELAARGIEVANEILTRLHTRALARQLSERVAKRRS
jgi:hypothetical protein